MNQEHKDFITEELCPFILREQGNGFAMESWSYYWPESDRLMHFDGVLHQRPACNTVACVGGSVELLTREKDSTHDRYATVSQALGLSIAQTTTLCYGWKGTPSRWLPQLWPTRYVERYAQAETALAKAEVVVALLHEVVATDGAVLDEGEKYEEDGN